MAVPVNVDVAANDLGDTGPPTVVSGPANGATTVEARRLDHLLADARLHRDGHLRLRGLQHGLAERLRARRRSRSTVARRAEPAAGRR